MVEYVLVSQGIEIHRTSNREEAIRILEESRDTEYYLQRCADEHERPADTYIYLYEEEINETSI